MNGTKRAFLGLLLPALLAAAGPLYAAKRHPAAGSTSSSFLKLDPGPRPLSMGGAFAAVSDDIYAAYWNPAGLSQLDRPTLTLMENEYIQGVRQGFAAYAHPLDRGTWAASFNGVFVPNDLERRSGLNENDPLNPITTSEGTFGASDMALGVSYARKLDENRSWGATVKIIRSSIDTYVAHGIAADLGGLWKYRDDISLGAALQNLGPPVKFIDRSYSLPLNFKTGVAWRPAGTGALLAFDINKPIDDYPSLSVGTQYRVMDLLALRAGYRYRVYGNELGGISGISTGLGLSFKGISIDYAFLPFGTLGDTHRTSLTFAFGKPRTLQSKPATATLRPDTAPDISTTTAETQMPQAPEISTAAALAQAEPGVHILAVNLKTKKISSQGSTFEVDARAPAACALTGVSFQASFRGLPNTALKIVESPAEKDNKFYFAENRQYRLLGADNLSPSSLKISLRVSKAWLAEKGLSRDRISLYARAGDAWQKQPTQFSSEDGAFEHFSSTSAPAELFIIGAPR